MFWLKVTFGVLGFLVFAYNMYMFQKKKNYSYKRDFERAEGLRKELDVLLKKSSNSNVQYALRMSLGGLYLAASWKMRFSLLLKETPACSEEDAYELHLEVSEEEREWYKRCVKYFHEAIGYNFVSPYEFYSSYVKSRDKEKEDAS